MDNEFAISDFLDPGIIMIYGCMFSGKTKKLISLARDMKKALRPVQVFKHSFDLRYGGLGVLTSHDGDTFPCVSIVDGCETVSGPSDPNVLYMFDEVQFFSPSIVEVVAELAERGHVVVVAGLNLDFRGEPFGSMQELYEMSHQRFLLTEPCSVEGCTRDAVRTQRFVNGRPAHYNDPVILVSAAESYARRCEHHHIVPGRPG